jgi:hypothetical protein
MIEPDWSTCTEEELWVYVASHLEASGITSVLVGGAVVSIYSSGAYESGDLDLVLDKMNITYQELDRILNQIGFNRNGTRNFYQHPECEHIFLEFLQPPVAIGDDYGIIPNQITAGNHVLKILSPTDCIKDRLASYIHFKARECLDQAVLVANCQPFERNQVRNWCEKEGAPDAFAEFSRLLTKQQHI